MKVTTYTSYAFYHTICDQVSHQFREALQSGVDKDIRITVSALINVPPYLKRQI